MILVITRNNWITVLPPPASEGGTLDDNMIATLVSLSSTLIRKLGGFFIRRKMEETEDGKKDILYRSLLHAVSLTVLRVSCTEWQFNKCGCVPSE